MALALILTGCKDKKKGDSFEGFTINQGSKLTMIQGEQIRLSMTVQGTGDPVYSYESADPAKVEVDETGVVYAILLTESPVTITVTGKVVVNNETIEKTATIAITVVDPAESFEFRDLFWMQALETSPEEKYTVYQIRRRRNLPEDPADGADVVSHINRVEGDTNNLRNHFPTYDEWVYLYTNEEGHEIGLFQDSVWGIRTWIVSTDVFVDADEGSFKCASELGCIMEAWMPFQYDKYVYVLGSRDFVEDLTANDTIRPDGVDPRPMPGDFQIGTIDEEANVAWVDYMLFDGPEVTGEDIWGKYDAFLRPMYQFGDGEGGVIYYPFYAMGYPTAGRVELGQPVGEQAWLSVEQYEFKANVYENVAYYCLATQEYEDEETGEIYTGYVVPHEMSNTKEIIYSKVVEEGAPAKKAMSRYSADNMQPMPRKAFEAQRKVANTMGAIFRLSALRMK